MKENILYYLCLILLFISFIHPDINAKLFSAFWFIGLSIVYIWITYLSSGR